MAVDASEVAPVIDLEPAGPPTTLVDTLRLTLDDPGLDVVYWRPATGRWIDDTGRPTTPPAGDTGRAFTTIERGGDPVAALVHDPVLLDDPERLRAASRAAALAIDDEHLKAELRAQLLDEQAARRRIVEVGDRQRLRVERNLHDGAQQRLVGLALVIRLASRKAEGDPAVSGLLAQAARELDEALEELRELARGLHPTIVDDAGLGGALEVLAERPGVPVTLSVELPGRLPELLEVGAYHVVAEALANANQHAEAGQVTVRATIQDGSLRVAVSDDGRGGAAPAPGSGLEGLADRVSALGGQLAIESPTGGGTTVVAAIPLHWVQPLAPNDPTDRRMRALKWIGWQNHELPGEILEQQTEEDNLHCGKAILLAAGGNSRITHEEREWLLGYLTAAGDSERVIEAVKAYEDGDRIEDIFGLPKMIQTRRGMLYDALRVCAADGSLSPDERDRVLRAADAISISDAVVDDLHEIVLAEQALRRRRYELIVGPTVTPQFEGSWAGPSRR